MNTLFTLGNDTVVSFAARELARYAKKITGQSFSIKHRPALDASGAGIWLGLCSDYGLDNWPQLSPSYWDDGFAIRQKDNQLLIAGSNGRSVLFGVYAYLESLGVRWVRPGPNGELIPSLEALPVQDFEMLEKASYRHRGTCIEGAPSLEHVLNMVDWMAKRRMNSFFLQFHHSGTFWNRWYARAYNPYFGKLTQLNEEDFYALDEKVIAEVKKRGMLLHQVGHGWTAASVDMPCNGWITTDLQVAPEKRRWLAKVDGKRELHADMPVNTELCYSYKPAFDALLNNITSYARDHPQVDVLHVWLSDSTNNKCECEQCAKMSPADWYMKLVNALSEQLYALNPAQRFVFLSYFESWWAPSQVSYESKHGNAILMFAPISRCFRHALADETCTESFSLRRPALNHVSMPATNQTFVKLLAKWWKVYEGDSFLFDYYLWSGLLQQASDISLAQIIHNDMRALKDLGLNGLISCQVMRSFWPTGLSMAAMAETTWNRKLRWSQIKQDHFQAAYGPDAEWALQYLTKLEKLILEKPSHNGTERLEAKQTKQLRAIEAYLEEHHVDMLARASGATSPIYRESFELLAHHNQFLLMRCQVVLGKLAPEDLMTWLLKSERQVHPFLDVPALITQQLHPLQPVL
jgi:hypothetical protein